MNFIYRRARATLSNSAPTLLDAVMALTNQSYIRATFNPPFLVMHTAEDPAEPYPLLMTNTRRIESRRNISRNTAFTTTGTGITCSRFWILIWIQKCCRAFISHQSHHFFAVLRDILFERVDALRAVALAGKTCFAVERKTVVFTGDTRVRRRGAPNPDFLFDKNSD